MQLRPYKAWAHPASSEANMALSHPVLDFYTPGLSESLD